MNMLDWTVLLFYLAGVVAMSWFLGRKQHNQEDYYLAGRKMTYGKIGLSVMATQVSAISLIGAPAFIALKNNGGLVWLQYEFAVPLAMMAIMLVPLPIFYRFRSVTIYAYLEERFGALTSVLISAVFIISRGLGSGVALLATAIVTSSCLQLSLPATIILIGTVSIIYTTFGGITADIYSDIIQLAVLWIGALITVFMLIDLVDISTPGIFASGAERLQIFNIRATGIGKENTFGFWPMLIGGFFLYVSYYGFDQSQTQRLLTASSLNESRKALLLNGLLRFPLVLTYSAIGILLIPFLRLHPQFAASFANRNPDFLVPDFLINYFPHGLLGIIIAGLFAASMSSIDSALNSLSAATYKDIVLKIFPSLSQKDNRYQMVLSRRLTVFWGMVATLFALQLTGGHETVLETVNKIGSAFYGPVMAVFWLGMTSASVRQKNVITGLIFGVGINILLWLVFADSVSWLWWNVAGFTVTYAIALLLIPFGKKQKKPVSAALVTQRKNFFPLEKRTYYYTLTSAFVTILIFAYLLENMLK